MEILNEGNPIEDNNYYEVNVRGVTAFREIGRGHLAILNFSRCMNMEEGGNARTWSGVRPGASGAVSGAFSELNYDPGQKSRALPRLMTIS